LIRLEEEQAAYVQKNNHTLKLIQRIADKFPTHEILILPRYRSQISELKKNLDCKVRVLSEVVNGNELLQQVNVFVGSGGTMTAEAALLGIPTISYNAVPNLVQDYLVRRKLVILESNPDKITTIIEKFLSSDNYAIEKNAKKVLMSMEDPYKKLIQVIKNK
jgi:predicted glycosyltransferase